MRYLGSLTLRRNGNRTTLLVRCVDLAAALTGVPGLPIRSLHFGTKLRGYDIKKGQGYGWDGHDYIRAKPEGKGLWKLTLPVRDNDPKCKTRRFIKGNCYVRTTHNEIYYFDLRKWSIAPAAAITRDGYGGSIIEIDVENIPLS